MERIIIEDTQNVVYRNNVTYRGEACYSSHAVKCSVYLKTFFEKELLANYTCDYTVKTENGKRYIEFPEHDLHNSLEYVAPSEWAICMVTEQFPKQSSYVIRVTFNVYKQTQRLGNKRYFDTVDFEFVI